MILTCRSLVAQAPLKQGAFLTELYELLPQVLVGSNFARVSSQKRFALSYPRTDGGGGSSEFLYSFQRVPI